MLSLVLAIVFSIAFASTATNETADCEITNGTLNVYQHPNASNFYRIPAVVSTGSSFMNSTTKTWQIINSIGNVSDSSNVVNPQAQQLSQYIFLDTTAAIPPAVGSMNLIDECDIVSETLNDYVATSSKTCSKNGPSIEVSQDLSYVNIDNCTNPPTTLPIQLFQQSEPFQQGNYATYDLWTKTTTPILLALFSNATTLNGTGGSFAQTYLTCTSPMNVTAGSHDPTSTADHAAVADVKSVVGFALAINALIFLML